MDRSRRPRLATCRSASWRTGSNRRSPDPNTFSFRRDPVPLARGFCLNEANRPGAAMFAVILTYRVDFPQIDPHVGAHLEWLDRGYAAGHFVMSGRRQPRTG